MENKMTFCDYINHPNFMIVRDKGDFFEVTMKSAVDPKSFDFYDIHKTKKTNTFNYVILFQKSSLWSRID